MGFARSPLPHRHLLLFVCSLLALVSFAMPLCFGQTYSGKPQELPWTQEMKKYPGLQEEFARLFVKIQQAVDFPPPRKESRLLPLTPKVGVFYIAIPNYGEVAAQVLKVFRQELEESAVLRDWWTHGQVADSAPKIESALKKFSQFHQYLGDEIVISATWDGKEPTFLVASEIRQPGFRKFFQQVLGEIPGKSRGFRLLEPQELDAAKPKSSTEELLVLVRPDFVVASEDIAALRSFNIRTETHSREFAETPFGRRVLQEYQGGTTLMAAADMQKALEKASTTTKPNDVLQQSGFADMQYLVWGHKAVAGKTISEMELSFISPRHGAAAWLAKPRPLGSLDFVSPNAMMGATFALTDPSQILEDVKTLAGPSKAGAFASIPLVEQGLNISLKDDLLSLLTGEITMEIDSFTPPQQPAWKVILGVNDADHLRQTLNTILTATRFEASQEADNGITYSSVLVPSGKTSTQVVYALADGYLILGPTRNIVADSLWLHRSGNSLAKSRKFLDSLPPGRSSGASALFYEDPIGMTAVQLKSQMPDLAETLGKVSAAVRPMVLNVYAEDSAIREISTNQMFDTTGVLIVAAIAIPNLLRSKIAANESSAVGSVRTINTAQVTYSATFPKRGFAPNLAALALDPRDPNAYSPEHAGLLEEHLANASCTGDAWCTKSGYQFLVTSICKLKVCKQYVVLATPISDSTGNRSFCSTQDGVIRYKMAASLTAAISATECKTWQALE